jgi:hypothetical protein
VLDRVSAAAGRSDLPVDEFICRALEREVLAWKK